LITGFGAGPPFTVISSASDSPLLAVVCVTLIFLLIPCVGIAIL